MVIGRLTATWADASFAVLAAIIALLSASLVNCPQVRIKSVSKAGIGITAATPPLGPIMVEDDDRESQEDDIKPCGLPGVRPDSPASPTHSQITPPQSVYISLLTLVQNPLRC